MKLPLSSRLLACADFVHPGDQVADVGCDHGYLSIYLLTRGIAKSVIASDINRQPLLSAINNAQKYGVREDIRFYLSDGVENIPRDFDCLICAGMGADTMISILTAAPWLRSADYRLILQCQSKTPSLRRYLSEEGWHIIKETVLRDGRFLYTIMEAVWAPDAPKLTPAQCHFPPALLVEPAAELPAYFRWVTEGLRIAAVHQNDPEKAQILHTLTTDPELSFLKEDAQ